MVFWSWGRGLEDTFDDAHHRKLTSLIVYDRDESKGELHQLASSPAAQPTELLDEDKTVHLPAVHALGKRNNQDDNADSATPAPQNSQLYFKKDSGDLVPLQRIAVMSVFHKNTLSGQGVPHTFAAFLQRYPALPEVVVSNIAEVQSDPKTGILVHSNRGDSARRIA